MDSSNSSENCYATTPLKREGSSYIARHQLLNRGGNPYKTPIQNRSISMAEVKLSKNKNYKSVIIEKMPIYSPPSKNISFIKNPFEHAKLLKQRLSQPLCSPSLFKAVSSPAQNDDFTWSIDDISMLHPADIDENPSQDFDSWFSPVTESQAQEAINRFFSSHIVDMESPVRTDLKSSKIKNNTGENTLTLDTWTQTDMTLPPILPPDLEAILSRYCIFGGSQKCINENELNISSGSRKKLLFRNFSDYTPERKYKSSGVEVSTPITSRPSSPELSPVGESSAMDISVQNKSASRLNCTKDIASCEKENGLSKDWNCQGCSTPRNMTRSCDSAFSSV